MKAHRRPAILFALLATATLSACGSYYKVTDPASGTSYYTKDVDRDRKTGAVQFEDARTGADVTLTSSEVHEISKDDYKTAVKK